MGPIDAHYTPSALAAELIEAAAARCVAPPSLIADFAAGRGSLLDAAAAKWPSARIAANDMHAATASRLRRARPAWSVASADFVDQRSVRRSINLKRLGGAVDLVLLNPPFTQARGDLHDASVEGVVATCGRAAAFVVRSLYYVPEGGAILSILPDGCLSAERDRDAWRLIQERCEVRVEQRNRRGTFAGAYPATSIVSIVKRFDKMREPVNSVTAPASQANIVRGWKPMHLLQSHEGKYARVPLIHTTALKDGRVELASAGLASSPSFFQGPALLLPRVGRPSPGKMCVLTTSKRVALSDCVLAIPFATVSAARSARRILLKAWSEVENSYAGTGAPYVTISKIRVLLDKLHIVSSHW